MNEHKYLFVEPGRDRRRRQDRLKVLQRQPAGADRARQLAQLARELHDNREINLALDAARIALEDTDGDPAVLVEVYTSAHQRADLQIDDLSMLASLGQWLQDDRLCRMVRAQALDAATRWCGAVDGRERERRLDTLRRRFDDDLADQIDVALL